MQQKRPDSDILALFRAKGNLQPEVSQALGAVIQNIVNDKEPLTKKTLIIYLIDEIESSQDRDKTEIFRQALEIIVNPASYPQA